MHRNRRHFMIALAAGLAAGTLPAGALAAAEARRTTLAAAWRGPNKDDPYFAGMLVADWESRKLEIRHAIPLPSRPHGLLPEAGGGMLVTAARPGTWLLRCDADGKVVQQVAQDDGSLLRFCGHAVVARNEVLLTTETDHATGRGRVGIRDLRTLKKLDEWDSHGIDPHQLLLDAAGNVIVANGGVPRTLADRKVDLPRMDASLVRLDGRSGRLQRQWRLDDPRLSLRHLAWSHPSADDGAYLGVAIQAEHDRAEERARAPILAVLDGDRLFAPTRANDNFGYAGDIAAAWDGGFVLSSNQVGLAQLWHPAAAERMTPLVRMEEAYALASWQSGGVLVATALGLVRSHPAQKPLILPWPQPMALDNHWSLIGEA